jgi:hypothetical protein
MSHLDPNVPTKVGEFAAATVEYVAKALGVQVEYDSDTLPVLDHYLRTIPNQQPDTIELVSATSGAYFGEVVRRRLGGRWKLVSEDPESWLLILPTGLTFSPVGVVHEAILQSDVAPPFDIPAKLRPYLEDALERMGEVTLETYYSLCGRLDTLEHIQAVLLAVAAKLAKKQAEG